MPDEQVSSEGLPRLTDSHLQLTDILGMELAHPVDETEQQIVSRMLAADRQDMDLHGG